ncbi:MAG: MBL fold metallo-hydrolase [Xanthomonadales bacterium]|nr:MBL fold metallo-hydrolase [Gammaproteobacteria bacterium]MBT8052570.1 MBL fold metallo-hydrolase [Gammaproteobacteria bacterium]NND57749.1 MBL fold metallo-hydrolase [Xanthomonadales bacterium]NNK51464.1 MBL fold metallo-hydrolase [Xanthomonadales bacterium]
MADRPASLTYPLGSSPETGDFLEIAPGVRWLRLPLPFLLNHINVWLLRDGDGWAIVDTGLFTSTTREIWKMVFAEYLDQAPITRILVTHMHPDHVGCAGWLARKFGVDLWMSRDEYLLCRILVADTGKPAPPEGVRFYKGAGFADQDLDRYMEHFGAFGRVVSPLPESYRQLREGLNISIGEYQWRVIMGRGHSPEHACLFCEELNLLIAGDQILPTISSNVSVYPTEPLANPLEFWFESLHRLRRTLPPDVLVLPAHGKPFHGAHTRLGELISEHQSGLDKLRAFCQEPRRALDVFPALFKSRINDRNLIMATGEAVSHLNYLVENGEMTSRRDKASVNWYQMCQ